MNFAVRAISSRILRVHVTPDFARLAAFVRNIMVRRDGHTADATNPFAVIIDDNVYERRVTLLPDGPTVDLRLPIETCRGDSVLFGRLPADVLSITRIVAGRPSPPGQYLETTTGLRVTSRNWNTIELIGSLKR